jgi:phage/plasmid-associated DNA primase
LLLPSSSLEEQQAWKEEADPVNSFCLDCLEESEEITPSAKLYREFQIWYDLYSGGHLTKHRLNSFVRKVKDLGYEYGRTNTLRGFRVSIKEKSKWHVNQMG